MCARLTQADGLSDKVEVVLVLEPGVQFNWDMFWGQLLYYLASQQLVGRAFVCLLL